MSCNRDQCSLLCPPLHISHDLAGTAGKEGFDDTVKTFSSLQIRKMPYDKIMVKNSTLCMDFYFQMDSV